MSHWLLLPQGDAVSNVLIKSVSHLVGRGVICRDAQQRIVAFIKVVNDEKGRRVRDLLIKSVNEGPGATQPNWSFLDEEDEVAG